MKRIMTGVILVLAVLVFSSSGALAKDQLEGGNTIHIKIKGKKMLRFQVEYDASGNPIGVVDKDDNSAWEGTNRPSLENEVISIFTTNPCTVCIGSTCWRRNC